MNEKYLSPYDPTVYEEPLLKEWDDSGYTNPEKCIDENITDQDAETFSVVLPPPNVTGTLHLGHAYENSIQDLFVRFHRMRGKKTLWIPGADSAALATQEKVEKIMYKEEKLRRQDIGRDALLERVGAFALESQQTIINQVKRIGSSLDWSRFAYTMDETRHYAVNEAFVRMFNAGLIEKGHYIVNWDPKMQTTVSDDEQEYKEETTTFYEFQYGPFVIGTARPETKFGDKYVVMHPDDTRYSEYEHGQKIEVEWINGTVTATVLKDEAVDPEFGTGVMTITPWHDKTDFEIAGRHNLEYEQVIDFYGKMLPIAGEKFAGLSISKAREAAVEALREKGLVVSEKEYVHSIATNERGGGKIEPQIKEQWFVRVNKEFVLEHSEIDGIPSGSTTTLKEIMRAAVGESMGAGQVTIMPERYDRIYRHWIDNLHDWCISRQIWFGHRIPVWYRDSEVYCGHSAPEGEGWSQDEDTLDTWFSSALWPFSTLGWPEQTADLEEYFPNAFMNPGYEILPFWVARMILASGFLTGKVPFKTVYLHGMLRDAKGQKFSKSLGNGIDPIDLANQHGVDAMRMALLTRATPGNDVNFDEQQVRSYKKFANKLWNIARFVYSNTEDFDYINFETANLSEQEKKIIEAWEHTKTEITDDLENYRIHLAAEKLYHYVWHTFADEVIESTKEFTDPETRLLTNDNKKYLLLYIMQGFVKALHPFMPFVTSEIWKDFPIDEKNMLLVEKW